MKPKPHQLTLVADNSQIKQFCLCPRSWYYRYVKNLSPKGPISKALDMGTLTHCLLDFYYTQIALKRERHDAYKYAIQTFEKQYKLRNIPTDLSVDEIKFIAGRFFNYHSYYSAMGDLMPLLVHGKPMVETGFSIPILDTENFLFVLEGKIDMITTDHSFVDHKTQGRIYDHYQYDTQWLTYGLATGCTKVVVNYVGTQKKLDQDTFRRLPLQFPKSKLDQYRQFLIEKFYQMANCINTNTFPTDYTKCSSAEGMNKPCSYTKIDEPTDQNERIMNMQAFYTDSRPRWEPWKLEEK